ncbi:MAG: Gfo/Idh/MocA family oxidoreductase [Chitinophagaceae bacterium]
MKKKKIHWGILGCGRIAQKFASDLALVKDAKLTAVASRELSTAKAFAKKFPAHHVHGSYEELVQNTDVDVIYIATPHSHHYEHTLLCLEHNKAVLCEKAFAINSKQAKEMIQVARDKNIFLMEAFWTKFLPHYKKTVELVQKKKLGDIQSVLVNFGFKLGEGAPPRLLDPALGGGTMLDIGVYNVFMALSFLGTPDKIEAHMTPASTGVDEQCAVLFSYNNGAMAQLFSSFTTNLPTEVQINGTEGRIRLTSRFYEPSSQIQFSKTILDPPKIIKVKKEKGIGFHHEAKHVTECLQQGLTESPVMTHAHTLLLMETVDEIRRVAGIKYSVD